MSGGTAELLDPRERAELEELARGIEHVRAAVAERLPPATGDAADLAHRRLNATLLGAAAAEIAALLHEAGALEDADAEALDVRLGDPAAVSVLVAWGATGEGEPPFAEAPLAWEVVRLALPPFLRRAAESGGEESAACPACGAHPDLAIIASDGARSLVCSVCETAWRFDRVRCPFCGNEAQDRLAYLVGGPRGFAIRVCEACRTYLKTVDHRAHRGEETTLLLRLLTAEMDLAAQQQGYRAP